MIKVGDYTIEEYPKQNKLVVTIPQLWTTATSSTLPIGVRKSKLSEIEMSIILTITKAIYEGEYDEQIKEQKNE